MKPTPSGIKGFSNEKKEPHTLTYGERYYILRGEVLRFKRALLKLSNVFSFRKWAALEVRQKRMVLKNSRNSYGRAYEKLCPLC